MSDDFPPQLQTVEALAPYRLRTIWSTGEVLELDVGDRLRRHADLAPILDPAVFVRVHISEWGHGIEWIDEEFGADNVYAWAKEQAGEVSHKIPVLSEQELLDLTRQRLAGKEDAIEVDIDQL